MIRQPEFITFTGIDDRTDLERADKLASAYPIEWGILMSQSSHDARFPSTQAVGEILQIHGRKSAHLCGITARLASSGSLQDLLTTGGFSRTQVNGFDVLTAKLLAACEAAGLGLVVQTRATQFTVSPAASELFDCSGGRGLLPDEIPPTPSCGSLVGYAVGMGPDSVTDYLTKIQGDGPFWIDMEGRIRTNGWFDLDLVEEVCRRVYG